MQKSASDIEKEQEALLMAKFGGMKPKAKLIAKEKAHFDSADWALAKQGVAPPPDAQAQDLPLPAKLAAVRRVHEPAEKAPR